MSKTKLEKVLEHLIENDQAKAGELLHEYIIESARKVHESIIAEDDDLEDEDLEALGDDEVDGEEYVEDEDLVSDEEASDELESELEGEENADGASEDVEDRLDDLEDELEKLRAEFEELAAIEDEEHGDEYNYEVEDADDSEEADEEGDENADEDGEGDDEEDGEGDEDEEVDESLDWDEDDFLALDEGIVDELEELDVSNSHGEVGAGSKVNANNKSPIPQKKHSERKGAKGVEVKSTNHSGFDREKAPSFRSGTGAKSPRNTRGKATDDMKKVDRNGDSSAKLNSRDGFGQENSTSPISGKGRKK